MCGIRECTIDFSFHRNDSLGPEIYGDLNYSQDGEYNFLENKVSE